MQPPSEFNFPQVQMLAWKHVFAPDQSCSVRYMTLMVSGVPGRFQASLFGTQHGQVDLPCSTMQDGCVMAEHKFRELFPDHVCGDECHMTWHPLLSGEEQKTNKVQ